VLREVHPFSLLAAFKQEDIMKALLILYVLPQFPEERLFCWKVLKFGHFSPVLGVYFV
jgi:hypothetical protein